MKIIRLLDVETFRELQPINEDTDSTTLKKVLYNAQESKIQEFLGTALYKKVLDLVDTGDITNPQNAIYKTLLDDYVRKVLSYWGYVEAIPHMTYQFTDKGVQQRDGNHSRNADRAAVKEKMGNARNAAEFQTSLMIEWLCDKSANIPEYSDIDDAGIAANTKPYFSGMELGYGEDYDRDLLERPAN